MLGRRYILRTALAFYSVPQATARTCEHTPMVLARPVLAARDQPLSNYHDCQLNNDEGWAAATRIAEAGKLLCASTILNISVRKEKSPYIRRFDFEVLADLERLLPSWTAIPCSPDDTTSVTTIDHVALRVAVPSRREHIART